MLAGLASAQAPLHGGGRVARSTARRGRCRAEWAARHRRDADWNCGKSLRCFMHAVHRPSGKLRLRCVAKRNGKGGGVRPGRQVARQVQWRHTFPVGRHGGHAAAEGPEGRPLPDVDAAVRWGCPAIRWIGPRGRRLCLPCVR